MLSSFNDLFYPGLATFDKKRGFRKTPKPLISLVIVSGFEPLAIRLGALN